MINDSLGHDAGDRLLVLVGERLQACARSSDTVARLGGDEFAILLEDEGDAAGARVVADRLLTSLKIPFEVLGREVFMRASIGIALSAGEPVTTGELIRNADTAMYAAKVAGKGRYEFFQPIMHVHAMRQFEVQADLQRALDRDEFEVHFQPIVDFSTGSIGGTEALVRWRHPTRGLLPPLEFIGVAEETGLIVPLGSWVMGEACRRTAGWRARYPNTADLWVSVNLSTRQLIEPDLAQQVQEVLDASGLDPAALILEITEGSLMRDVSETTARLRELKALGVRLAIDDFGTGSSSLGYLRQFPIDLLKIDKSFVDEVATGGPQGPALVRAIVELAQTLNLDTIAEGIEQGDQLDELRSVGCDSGQGFLFARPLPSDAMDAFLRDSGAPFVEPRTDGASATH
jgi:diguanylate cyclase (GGDEF)-like protein